MPPAEIARPSPPGRDAFTPGEWAVVARHRTPKQVQELLRVLPYNRERGGETLRTFRQVVRRWEAHCLEGALTAATILEQHGYPPLLLDLESRDKLDHVLFLFRQKGRWGTVALSRDFGLHGRKPLFRTVRALVMTYVDPYVDHTGRITGYGVYDLRTLDRCDWRFSERNVWKVEQTLIDLPHRKLRTSDRRHREALRRFRYWKRHHPHESPTYFEDQHLWL